ncbi:hypothetical protein CYLTODRAFT_439902 [Cylindrobasidium torrendii FP15055 ss-10]|uniref:Uncharacterized protein n=1 Tax=Cylindrobasidium torrendii FP15055 ss-10 TaxID=1314674 RepID=A0A0D7BSW2_9AGAR|nr:hypothetical protein CYLTODRAFT_439902 [Cylindrobasidium torrendii FP15055 ss-10]
MAGSKNVTYDDRDQTHLIYQSYWFHEGAWNATNVGKTGTLSSTELIDANVSFIFPEPANAFYYYGIPRCCGGTYGLCIDCDPNDRQFIEIDAVNATDDGHNEPVVLFSHHWEEYGTHEIILKNMNDTRFGSSQLTIDRFVVQVEDPTGEAASSSAQSSASPTSSSSATASAEASGSSTPTGTIAGGVVGGVLALVLFAGILFCLRKRRVRQAHLEENSAIRTEPFMASAPTATSVSGTVPSSSTSALPTTLFTDKRQPSSDISSPTDTHSPVQLTSQRSNLSLPRRRETDAGRLAADEDLDEDNTLPPEYQEVFRTHPGAAPASSSAPAPEPSYHYSSPVNDAPPPSGFFASSPTSTPSARPGRRPSKS